MPRIQLIIEAESAKQLANDIIQMANRYRLEEPEPSEALKTATTATKGNGSDMPEPTTLYQAPAPGAVELLSATETSDEPEPVTAPKQTPRKAKKAAAPPVEPEAEPEAMPVELPPLDEMKNAITKAVVAEPHGGPIRTALETLRPTLGITLIRNAKEEHRAALWRFIDQHNIPIPAAAQV